MSTIIRFTIVFSLVVICFSPKAIAQDLGAPDSLILIPSELEAGGNDSLFTLEVWVYNDANIRLQVQFGFSWDSDLITLDHTIVEPNVPWTIYGAYDGSREQSNTNNRALFWFENFAGLGISPSPNRQLLVTYYFIVSDWTVSSEILIDSAAWDDGTEMLFYSVDIYLPVWSAGDEKISVRDVNINPDGSCCGVYTGGQTGNIDCDPAGERNIADLTILIDRIFITKTTLCCEENGNVDGDLQAKMNLSDITSLIDHIYLSKAETALCD